MTNAVPLLLLLILLLGQLPSAAQIGDLQQLKSERDQLDGWSDELMSTRVRLVARTDSIDRYVDSLRRVDPESLEPLDEARNAAHQLVVRLETVDMTLDTLSARRDSLDEALRDAYDWQISRLQGMLRESFDEGLYGQLTVYQEERHELGLRVLRSPLREMDGADPRLALSEDDGPMELQMKIQLAQDQVAHYRQEIDHIDDRLLRMEHDAVLAAEMWRVREEFAQLRQRNQEIMQGLVGSERPVQQTPTQADRADRREAEVTVPPPARPILLRITQLKTRRQELEEISAICEERLGVLHQHLQVMLEPAELPVAEADGP